MRPLRLLILLLAIALALVLALMRPLQGRAVRATKKPGARPARHEILRERRLMSHPPADAGLRFGRRVVAYARHFIGVPYRYGGTSPRGGFDCSGLVRFV